MIVHTYTRGEVEQLVTDWPEYRKKTTTRATRIEGEFAVKTSEGTLTCKDGYLAVDSRGWPYPIDREEFEAIYEAVPVEA